MDDERKQAFYAELEKAGDPTAAYDYLVLFSGGKDSSYLAHIAKGLPGGRVCLFAVENGFEAPRFVDQVKETADKLSCDLFLHQPLRKRFKRFYRFLITEPSLRAMDGNPLCFFCGRYLMSLGVEFAERYRIPYVFYGATPHQVQRGEPLRNARDIKIFEMVSRKVFQRNYAKVKSLETYQQDPVIREMTDRVFYVSNTVKTYFPFLYLGYRVDEIKAVLESAYGWLNPERDRMDNGRYLTSGCRLVELFGVLTDRLGFSPHEPDQLEWDHARGHVDDTTYRYTKQRFKEMMSPEMTAEIQELAHILEIHDLLDDSEPKKDDG